MARTAFTAFKQFAVGDNTTAIYTVAASDFTITHPKQLEIIVYDNADEEHQRVLGDDTIFLSSVVIAADGGCTITLTANLPTGFNMRACLANDLPTQDFEFRNKDSFTLSRIEDALDFQAGAIQRLTYRADRAIRISDRVADDAAAGAKVILPLPAANHLIGWNTAADEIVTYSPSAVAAAAAGLTDTDELAEGSTNLYYHELKTTKGDFEVRNASGNQRFGVGANNTSLVADSAEAAGFKWAHPTGGVRSVITTDTPTTADNLLVCSGSSFTITVPAANGTGWPGKTLSFCHRGGSSDVYTISVPGIETTTMQTNSESLTIMSDGSSWNKIGRFTDTSWGNLGAASITGSTSDPTKGTIVKDISRWRRAGREVVIKYDFEQSAGGTDGSGNYIFTLPSYLSIDLTYHPAITGLLGLGDVAANQGSVIGYGHISSGTARGPLVAFAKSATTFSCMATSNFATYLVFSSAHHGFAGTDLAFGLEMRFVVDGWTA